jgi:hypothetical protein
MSVREAYFSASFAALVFALLTVTVTDSERLIHLLRLRVIHSLGLNTLIRLACTAWRNLCACVLLTWHGKRPAPFLFLC